MGICAGDLRLLIALKSQGHIAHGSSVIEIGGVMIHNVPAQGMFNHGLINYNPKFFWMLARSNGYKWMHVDFSHSSSVHDLPPDIVNDVARFVPDFAERARSYAAADCGIM